MSEPNDPNETLDALRHDVRSPLTVITGFADLLAHGTELALETRQDYARRIVAAAEEIRLRLEEADL